MSSSKDRAANRQNRRKIKNSEPLLRLVQEEVRRKPVKPQKIDLKPLNDAQRAYHNAIDVYQIVFGEGPAGTGKTWYAAMRAAKALDSGEIERIIVTRPAVEAGESLGFLPGEMDEKYEPYFRPVRDALEEYFGTGHLEYLMKSKVIEARPLAFLRGATIKNAWLIADEMQNSTPTQMKMLLTRIGENARFIVNGDMAQKDLPAGQKSGLEDAMSRLAWLNKVGIVRFAHSHIVRSDLCQEIVAAYEKHTDTDESICDNEGVLRTLGA